LLDPLFSFIATEAAIYRLTGEVRERTGSRSEATSPRNVFRIKDGRYISISASIQAMAERLFRAIGREDMLADPRFRTNTDRVRNAAASRRRSWSLSATHPRQEYEGLRARRGHRGTRLRYRSVHGRPAWDRP
jgi:crotonobetainyl-CoA:carnitine CoA-transferase CaiB-like acyl-CoA transferase